MNLNGQKIDSPAALQGVVEQLIIGKSYPLEILREGNRQKLNVTIEQLTKEVAESSRGEIGQEKLDSKFDKYGLQLHSLTRDLARQFGLKATTGLVVTEVEDGSAAEQGGIKPGDIIEKAGGQTMNSVEDYQKASTQSPGSDGFVLNVRSANGRRFFVILKVD